MIIKDFDFFKQFIDEDMISFYIELSNLEEQNIINANTIVVIEQLKTALKIAKKDNQTYLFHTIINQLLYQYNRFFDFAPCDPTLEQTFQLYKQAYHLEKKCLKILKKELLSSEKQIENPKNQHVSIIFLYLSALSYKMNSIYSFLQKELKENESRIKGFNANFPNFSSAKQDIEDIEYITSKVKALTSQS